MTDGKTVYWRQLRLHSVPEIEEGLVNYLFEIGSLGVQQEGAHIIAYFPHTLREIQLEEAIHRYLKELAQLGWAVPKPEFDWVNLPDQDWNAEWKRHFKPIAASRRFTVKPTWEEIPAAPREYVIEIDPKQAFGTGTHATTRLMLQLLEQLDVSGRNVLDVGCGTAILAIAAAFLGAARVTAFDVDPVAVLAAKENVLLNSTSGRTLLFAGSGQAMKSPGVRFDIVLANLTKNVIVDYLDEFEMRSDFSGDLLLSGILTEELAALRARLAATSFVTVEERREDEWVALHLKKGHAA